MAHVKVYGANWCGPTTKVRKHLDQLGIPYEYIDIDRDEEAAKWVAEQNGGKEKKPTIEIDGRVLSTPSTDELDRALDSIQR